MYTDRSIYRPQQKIMWKILSYRSEKEMGKFQVNANSQQVVSLKDMNGQVVERKTVKTDEFGAAWGNFDTRRTGSWKLEFGNLPWDPFSQGGGVQATDL
ncbi:MAG: hypothetical protein IPK04_08265 [Bdellovibrionales bacterium]|nr:hypothetical protein [Bdellovibrionales bacterium]